MVSQGIDEFMSPGIVASEITGSLPFVSVDWPTARGPSILVDLDGAGYQATRHLIEHGHRRIGLITYFIDGDNIIPVNKGYFRALEEAGIQTDVSLVARVKAFDPPAGEEGARYLASLVEPPTAIFAIADTLAAGAMQGLKSMGYRIPEDIALIGFNDIPLAQWLNPPLTTVSAPSYEMGKSAMNMLQNIIARKSLPQQRIIFPVSLVIRQSCGPHTG